jgi:hypothetical protein
MASETNQMTDESGQADEEVMRHVRLQTDMFTLVTTSLIPVE